MDMNARSPNYIDEFSNYNNNNTRQSGSLLMDSSYSSSQASQDYSFATTDEVSMKNYRMLKSLNLMKSHRFNLKNSSGGLKVAKNTSLKAHVSLKTRLKSKIFFKNNNNYNSSNVKNRKNLSPMDSELSNKVTTNIKFNYVIILCVLGFLKVK